MRCSAGISARAGSKAAGADRGWSVARSTGQPANLIQARVGLPVHVDELKRDQPERITLISEYKFGVGHRYQRLVLKPEQIADLMQESEF